MKLFLPLLASLALAPSALAQLLPPKATGSLYVGDFSNDRVVVYDRAGTVLRTLTAPGLDGPRGVLTTKAGTLYVAAEHADAIFVFDARERFLASFTAPGLDGPTGMALAPWGELYVSAYHANAIYVFEPNGTFVRSFTAPGFTSPNCVAFDSQGFLYASSALTDFVFRFDPGTDTLIGLFTAPAPSSLDSPMSIARNENDWLFVSGGLSNNVCVFLGDGTFLGDFSHPDLPFPQGLAFDERGHLYASSFSGDCLVEFDAGLQYVQTIRNGGLDAPRSLSFAKRPAVRGVRVKAGPAQPR